MSRVKGPPSLIEQARRKGWPVHGSIYTDPATFQDANYARVVEANVAKRKARPKEEAA